MIEEKKPEEQMRTKDNKLVVTIIIQDGTNNDRKNMVEFLQKTGLNDKYHFLITNQVIKFASAQWLIEELEKILNKNEKLHRELLKMQKKRAKR